MIQFALIQAGVTPHLALETLAVFVPLIACARLLRIHNGEIGASTRQQPALQEAYHTQDNPHQQ